jgi:hypothetical protein
MQTRLARFMFVFIAISLSASLAFGRGARVASVAQPPMPRRPHLRCPTIHAILAACGPVKAGS